MGKEINGDLFGSLGAMRESGLKERLPRVHKSMKTIERTPLKCIANPHRRRHGVVYPFILMNPFQRKEYRILTHFYLL